MNGGRQRPLFNSSVGALCPIFIRTSPRDCFESSENISMPLALDDSLYDFTEEELTFFKQQTGIPDDDELKAHIFRVQAEAYEVCICEL